MGFDPKTDKYPYPKSTDKHYIILKKNDGAVFDEHYPYVDRSPGFRFKRFWMRVGLFCLAFPIAKIRLGLRVKGRKNLKKHKELLSCGALSCSNHVHFWDYIAVMYALRPRSTDVLVWAENVRGENKKLIRMVGGIPIPDSGVRATVACMKATKQYLDGGWLHVYAEGSMWEYYRPVRPFKPGIGQHLPEHGQLLVCGLRGDSVLRRNTAQPDLDHGRRDLLQHPGAEGGQEVLEQVLSVGLRKQPREVPAALDLVPDDRAGLPDPEGLGELLESSPRGMRPVVEQITLVAPLQDNFNGCLVVSLPCAPAHLLAPAVDIVIPHAVVPFIGHKIVLVFHAADPPQYTALVHSKGRREGL